MSKKRVIPFWMWPGSWGLNGKVYEEAKAFYYLKGEALHRRLVEIEHDGKPEALSIALLDLDLKYGRIDAHAHDVEAWKLKNKKPVDILTMAAIDFKHGKISEFDYDKIVAENCPEGIERETAMLDVLFKHREISKHEYDKEIATINDQPWIGIIDQGFDQDLGVNGVYFEFDWNNLWIDYLRLNGYTGHNEEEIVEHWFQDVCRATAMNNANPDEVGMLIPSAGRAARMPSRTKTIHGDSGTFYS